MEEDCPPTESGHPKKNEGKVQEQEELADGGKEGREASHRRRQGKHHHVSNPDVADLMGQYACQLPEAQGPNKTFRHGDRRSRHSAG